MFDDNNKQSKRSRRKSGRQGFASMDPSTQRKIASKGGKAAHQSGNAHEWNSEEAKAAGRRGGSSRSSQNSNSFGDLEE